ncbi:MAG: EpsI family protein [Nitrospiraceae bacterium]|nr:MAG: EpsI family protein [Nitrospiraceae bacterium]
MNKQNMHIYKFYITIFLLSVGLISFFLPKAKYEGTGFISQLKVPHSTSEWSGQDVTEQLNLTPDSSVFNFISDALAYQYVNKQGDKVLFIILDAGNFHNPKVCYTSAGYKIEELDDTEFQLQNGTLRTHTLLTEKGNESFLTFYWISIDKDIAHQWIEQKLKQLYFSMFNKKRVGLMVRVDIPLSKNDMPKSVSIAKDFIRSMSYALDPTYASYILGRH